MCDKGCGRCRCFCGLLAFCLAVPLYRLVPRTQATSFARQCVPCCAVLNMIRQRKGPLLKTGFWETFCFAGPFSMPSTRNGLHICTHGPQHFRDRVDCPILDCQNGVRCNCGRSPQENLKHTLPGELYDFEADSSIDLRIGYEAQHLDWLSLQRITQEALLPPDTEDRPATLSLFPVRCIHAHACVCHILMQLCARYGLKDLNLSAARHF